MSGILSLVVDSGRAADPALVAKLTAAMSFRGPDGVSCRAVGAAALGQTHLRATDRPFAEAPVQLDDELWIVADARLDERAQLARSLGVAAETTADAELILRAHALWGESLVEHLTGDFTFALWDGHRQCLVAARDRLGIKPFYYAPVASGLVAGNTLRALRLHPEIGDDLDERAIGDYLLYGFNAWPAATMFAGIRRLPPGHLLRYHRDGRLQIERYWQMPVVEPLVYRRPQDYVEHFRHLLEQAVVDRLSGDRIAVLMSGGLDSTAVAAIARRRLAGLDTEQEVRAHTLVYRRLIADEEEHFSSLAARHLGIEHDLYPADDYRLFDRWDELAPPEPIDENLLALDADRYRRIAERTKIVLTGFGGDPALLPERGYLWRQLGKLRLDRAAAYVVGSLVERRRLPPLGLHGRWHQLIGRWGWRAGFPAWLDDDFSSRLGLEERWRQGQLEETRTPFHRDRQASYRALADPIWAHLFETLDPGFSGRPVEHRHPFLDLRLLRFVLAVPPVPWCLDKHLLRQAMIGLLPGELLARPKSPLAGYPLHAFAHPPCEEWARLRRQAPALSRFLDLEKVATGLRRSLEQQAGTPYDHLTIRPLSLAYWLTSLSSSDGAQGEYARG